MKTYFKIFIIASLALFAASCEKDWNSDNEDLFEMNIYMIAEADSVIRGYVMPVLDNLNKNTFLYYENVDTSLNVTRAISDAVYTVNDGEEKRLNKNDNIFWTEYDLKAGDKVSIKLGGYYYKPLTGSAIVPDKPQIEVEYLGNRIERKDSSMIIKVKIKDDGNKRNYYMLNTVSYTERLAQFMDADDHTPTVQFFQKLKTGFFASDDPIFKDANVRDLKKKKSHVEDNYNNTNLDNLYFSKMPIDFTNVFSDASFNGKEYEVIIECPIIYREIFTTPFHYYIDLYRKHYVDIEVKQLSEEYYNYWKTWEHADLSVGVFNFSNVEGGMGILGAINRSEPVRIDYKR